MAEFEKKTKRHLRKLDRASVLTSMYVARQITLSLCSRELLPAEVSAS